MSYFWFRRSGIVPAWSYFIANRDEIYTFLQPDPGLFLYESDMDDFVRT
jgi:hypothetical protein